MIKLKNNAIIVCALIIVVAVLFFSNSGLNEGFNIFSPRDMFGISKCCYDCDVLYGYGSGYPPSKWCEECGQPGRGPCWNGSWTGIIGD